MVSPMRFQDKFLKKVKTIAEDAGLDFIQDSSESHSGVVRIQDEDFNSIATFTYWFGPKAGTLHSDDFGSLIVAPYSESEKWKSVMDNIQDLVNKATDKAVPGVSNRQVTEKIERMEDE